MSKNKKALIGFLIVAVSFFLMIRSCDSFKADSVGVDLVEELQVDDIDTIQVDIVKKSTCKIQPKDTIAPPKIITRYKTDYTILEKPILAFQMVKDTARIKELENQLAVAMESLKSKRLENNNLIAQLEDVSKAYEKVTGKTCKVTEVYDNRDYKLTIRANSDSDTISLSHNLTLKNSVKLVEQHRYSFGIGGGVNVFRDENLKTKASFMPSVQLRVKDHVISGGVDPINGRGMVQYNHHIGFNKWKVN